MIKLLIIAVTLCSAQLHAQAPAYPAKSWTWNVDFKDPDAIGPFIGREVIAGEWKAGADWTPVSIYHVDDASGQARRWFTAGAFLITNAGHLNATLGPSFGIDVMRWTSQPRITGPLGKAARFWKPLGLASITASVDLFAGWTPIHTPDIQHDYSAGFGFKFKARFGEGSMDAASSILSGGL